MVRKPRPDGTTEKPRDLTGEGPMSDAELRLVSFMSSVDFFIETVDAWDIKPQPLVDLVLRTLAAGCAIQFGVTRDGQSISIAMWQKGEKVSMGYSDDSEQFDAKVAIALSAVTRMLEAQRSK